MKINLFLIIISAVSLGLLGCGETSDEDTGEPSDTQTPDDTGSQEEQGDTGSEEEEIDTSPAREIVWIAISAGSFQMGCSEGDIDCFESESPVHEVAIGAFELMETEVTQAQYMEVTGEEPFLFYGCPNCPADSITWNKATAFCAQIGGYLPSESQWEYAARAGTSSRFGCTEDDDSCLDDVAWYLENSNGKPQKVATADPNAWGLYDMLGNVWEWVEDCWHDDYTNAPLDGGAWVEEGCDYRMVRGGAWGLEAKGVRITNRDGDYPDSYMLPAPGFRCAR